MNRELLIRRIEVYCRVTPRVWLTRLVKYAIVGILAVFFLSMISLFIPHRHQTSGPVSLANADDCPIPLPPSAARIQFDDYMHWVAFHEFVRFELAPADRVAYLNTLNDWWRDQRSTEGRGFMGKLAALPPAENLSDQRIFSDSPSWFDANRVTRGWKIGLGGPSSPSILIDADRNVFYWHVSD